MAKVAVVTGGASGIGRRTAERLLADGWVVWVFDGNAPGEEQVSVRGLGELRYERCDVRDVENLRRGYAHVSAVSGAVDALICSAGVTRVGELESTSIGDATLMFDVNVLGVWLTIREALPLLRKSACADDPARVVVVGSIAGIRPKVSSGFYGATKAAVHVLTGVFAVELAASGITVNAVAPGSTDTPLNAAAIAAGENVGFRASGPSPLGRIATPDDIASAILFLLGDGARYVNGVILPVDGGTRAAYDNRPLDPPASKPIEVRS